MSSFVRGDVIITLLGLWGFQELRIATLLGSVSCGGVVLMLVSC